MWREIPRCVATKTTREEIHPDKPLNSERYLKSAAEMAELFAWKPEALENTIRIAEQREPALPEPGTLHPATLCRRSLRMPRLTCVI